jgi:hypothetical protein
MGWRRGIIGARWFLPVLIGLTAAVAVVFGWGYMKGYNNAEQTYQEAMNKALADQLERLTSIHTRDIQNLSRTQERTSNVKWRIKEVYRPSCDLSPECLRAFNDGVRATGTHPIGVDPTSGTP